MLKIKLLLFILVLLINLAPATLNAQQRTRTKKPIPVKKESVSPKPKEVVAVKHPYNWNPVFTGQVSSLHTGKAGNEVFALTDSSLYRSENYGKDWTLVFSLPLNLPVPETPYTTDTFTWKLVFQQSKSDPQVMYLAAIGQHNNLTTNFYAGSLWKSVNGGKDWQHLNDNSYVYGSMPGDPRYKKGQGSVVSSLAISPKNTNTIYMIGVEQRLYKSLNGGTNWTDITPEAMSPYQISINPHDAENMYLLNGQWDPLETTDGGSTWHKLKYDLSLLDTGSPGYGEDTDRRWTWITFHPDMPKRMLGIVNSHLVVSDDGGKSWKDISFVTGTYRYRPGLFSEPRQGYKISSVKVLEFSGTATDTLYVSANEGVYKSLDLGKTWSLLFQEPTFDFVVSKDDKKILTATKLGTFQPSEDFSKWTNVGTSLPAVATTELSAIDSFDSSLYLIKSNGDLIKSSNSLDWEWERNSFKKITYKKGYNQEDFKVIQFFKTLDGTSYTVAAYSVYRKVIKETPDKNREEIKLPVIEVDWCNCRIALSKTDSQKIYLYSDKKLLVSNNGGVSWEESINNGVKVVAVSPQNSSTAYAVLGGNKSLNSVLTTTDGGKTWRAGASSLQDLAITLGITKSFQTVTVDPQNSNVAYVTSKNAVFRTSDSGQSWNLVTQNLFNGEIYDLTFDYSSSEIIFLATSNGVWQSKNSGKNWVSFSDKIPIYKIISSRNFTLAFSKEIIYRHNSPAINDSGEGIVPAPQAKTSASIRQVDFRNFTYTNVLHPSTEEKIHVEVRNGQFIYGNQISSLDWGFVIKEIAYGDVTNDGKEDAIVNAVMTTYGSSNPASVDKSNLFLYTLENGKPVLISNELGVLESYNPTVGDDCDSWIDVVSIKSILNEKIRVEAIVSSPSCFGKGYTGYKLAMSYRWSGSKFVMVGKPIKTRAK